MTMTISLSEKMAGRYGFSSSSFSQATMKVTTTPSPDLALTNLAYVYPSDLQNFAVPSSKLFLALIGNSFVLSLCPHPSIHNGEIALNAIQLRHAKVSTGDVVLVIRFIPPDESNLALLTLELEFVKKGTKSEQVDAVLSANHLRKRFIYQSEENGMEMTNFSEFEGVF
ncbi:vesicle-fusing ATPase-like [Cannabis sativa]|uniref:vesicle-fusing ATPase-like n=1 Tax=Cannabis sativa TaxID=3483 RepID=UPI0011DF0671|nr:vesicle-fusing ATPase-like [Cannabis sativa]